LEASGKYVFHGSGSNDLKALQPRQAYNHRDGGKVPDGVPAVFASSMADYAIMMALINIENCPEGYNSSATTRKSAKGVRSLHLRASRNSVEQLTEESTGTVYVFGKKDFQPREGEVEYISTSSVIPVEVVTVSKLDVPPDITIY